ncbi:sensor histidine kinase [Bacillus safensis]|uniref:sensor histidine kinase n=1 Tax=Bacillus safensis TaxID=561879 RepID=UPI00227EC361|nr:HAMP domain-containing sensor histidine kinase [Bacillus safensis]MCY7675938.1 HAMP domain-containing histidine kinase [Bacillus safensis]MCY7699485.1 HAMP domain-containing histidine kinase [Bacillus safensis]MEC3629033.1 HAMP domain-containing sensor histidine kinase [Bacillus safensis]
MKWRLTGRYMVSVIIVTIITVFINLFVFMIWLVLQANSQYNEENTPETFTRTFEQYISFSDQGMTVNKEGQKALKQQNAWIQILDENGHDVYHAQAPKGLKNKYTPIEIVNLHKYKDKQLFSTIFAGGKKVKGKEYSYFIGFKDPSIGKYLFSFDTKDLVTKFNIGTMILLSIDAIIALLIGYFFSRQLTKPLGRAIHGIQRLANGDYTTNLPAKGIYKDVFYNVNHLSEQLASSKKEKDKLEQMREEWITHISHDIKTPLASIQGYAEIIKDPKYPLSKQDIRHYADIIENKSLYIKDVMEDLNLTTRLKNNGVMLNKELVNIVSLLRETLIDILNDSRYADQKIELQTNAEKLLLNIDKILIRRAITNLILNALVHNDPDVTIIVQLEQKEHTRITIKDNGKGIEEAELEKVFDRYYRGTNTGVSHAGSGLGMAIAKDIIQKHGGDITIQSMIGEGTTIDIQLPA